MSLKAHVLHAINQSRGITEAILEQLESNDDWFYQAHPKANHAMWIAGHLALADNLFASSFRPETENKPEGYDELFWFGSEINGEQGKYPSIEEVRNYMRERRQNLLSVLEQVTEEELNASAPEDGPAAGAPSVGYAFIFAAFHEGMHLGQLTIAHRGLGHPPLYQPATAETP